MLFSAKTKGFFVEQNDQAVLLARTSGTAAPMVIEELVECPAGDPGAIKEAIKRLHPKKSPSGYLHSNCAVYPARRVVRCSTLEMKRVKEPGYYNEIMTTQLRIEPDKYAVYVLNSANGTDLDLIKPANKEVLFCGIPTEDIGVLQDNLLTAGLFPERLELATVGALGALVNYLAFQKSSIPTLMLEIGAETTHSFILTGDGVHASRPIPQGLESMVPVIQKELGLKDADSARKLFFSNSFDFTGMGPSLIKRLLKELQSSIGFYEVQTGQSIGQVICTTTPSKLAWLDAVIAASLGVPLLSLDLLPWLLHHQVTLGDTAKSQTLDARWFALLGQMISHPTPDVLTAKKKE
jgi:Tfp pilus assembly PilM family ATPase